MFILYMYIIVKYNEQKLYTYIYNNCLYGIEIGLKIHQTMHSCSDTCHHGLH